MSHSLKKRFGSNLRKYRRSAQLTQEQLAERAGTAVETISFIERGIHGPRFDLIEQLCDILRIDAAELFTPTADK